MCGQLSMVMGGDPMLTNVTNVYNQPGTLGIRVKLCAMWNYVLYYRILPNFASCWKRSWNEILEINYKL